MPELRDVPRRRFHKLAAATLLAAAAPGLARATIQGGWITIKIPTPPEDVAKLKSVKAQADATEPLMETGTAAPVRKYREFLDRLATQGKSQIDQIKAVNNYVNDHVARKPDGQNDVWAAPYQTLMEGGDCEDVALVKYWGMRRLKFDPDNLFLVMGMTLLRRPPEGHALLAVRMPSGVFLVMYNLVHAIENATSLSYFEPAFALNETGFWRIDRVDHVGGDYWRAAYLRAVKRQGGKG
ncbi:MAG: transglutaminase-like cysteine peptidase [Caulobacter sp.]|nr:transglutaminase-like cysteine peptidase [Caulobacter sp.]